MLCILDNELQQSTIFFVRSLFSHYSVYFPDQNLSKLLRNFSKALTKHIKMERYPVHFMSYKNTALIIAVGKVHSELKLSNIVVVYSVLVAMA